jgi:hypothetical protein
MSERPSIRVITGEMYNGNVELLKEFQKLPRDLVKEGLMGLYDQMDNIPLRSWLEPIENVDDIPDEVVESVESVEEVLYGVYHGENIDIRVYYVMA